jgi:hypothetical protein
MAEPAAPGSDRSGAMLRGAWIVSVQVSAAATIALLMMFGFLSLDAVRLYRDALQPGIIRQASLQAGIVFHQMGGDFPRGVLTMPRPRLRQILRARLAEFPALDYLAIAAPASGWVELAEGRSGLTRPSRDELLAPSQAAGGLRQLGTTLDIAYPLGPADGTAWLHIGLSPDRSVAAAFGLDLAIVLATLMVASVLALRVLNERHLLAPLRAALGVVVRGSRGAWDYRLDPVGLDETGRFCASLNALNDRMNARWQRVAWLADEVARAVPDRCERIAATLQTVRSAAHFASEPPLRVLVTPSPAVSESLTFFGLLAQTLPLAPPLLLVFDPPGGDKAVYAALPICAFAAALGAAWRLGERRGAAYGARGVFLSGCALAVLGNVAGVFAPALWVQIAAAAGSGAGIGLALVVCRRLAGGRVATLAGALAGITCGAGLGAVLETRIGAPAGSAVAAGLTCLIGLFGRRLILAEAQRGGSQQDR